MDSWVWLVAYVVGFGLLQLLLYRHFSRRTTTPAADGRTDTGGGHTPESTGVDSVHCQHCGTTNEAHTMVRYCRSCAESLR